MNDPERLLHGSPDGLSARLLRAGIDEAPAKQSLERTLVAVGAATGVLGAAGTAGAGAVGAGAVGAAGGGKAAVALTFVSLAKWAGVGVASGVALSLAAQVAERTSPRHVEPAVVIASAPPAPLPSTERVRREPEREAPPAEASVETEPHLVAPALAPKASADGWLGAPLAAEVTFVDRGRALFQHGDTQGAVAALAAYERTFTQPRLLPEVLYLRMEASLSLGERARASDIARRILRDYGKGPHAARARAVLSAP
jgi:hypothetical protein